jgi:hypothetical protein
MYFNELGSHDKCSLRRTIQHLAYAIRFSGCPDEILHYLGAAAIWRSSDFFGHFALVWPGRCLRRFLVLALAAVL